MLASMGSVWAYPSTCAFTSAVSRRPKHRHPGGGQAYFAHRFGHQYHQTGDLLGLTGREEQRNKTPLILVHVVLHRGGPGRRVVDAPPCVHHLADGPRLAAVVLREKTPIRGV